MSATKLQVSNLLSPNAVHTGVLQPIGSKSFMKKLIPAAIATILHRRTNFDATIYTSHQLNGTKYSMFNNKNCNRTIIDIRCWIKGALHAFERNYLRELYLLFVKVDTSSDVIESYKFKFNYFSDGEKSAITRDQLEQATTSLLQSINNLTMYELLQTDQFSPIIMLTYNEETPNEYEPPFHRTEDVTTSMILNQLSGGINSFVYLGHISTGFHSMKCCIKGSDLISEIKEESAFTSDEDTFDQVERDQHATDNEMEVEEAGSSMKISSEDDTALNYSSSHLRCLCKLNKPFTHIPLVECSECQFSKHAPCLGYLDSSTSQILCDECKGKTILSLKLNRLNQEKCIYQLTIAYAYFNRIVPFDVLDCATPKCKSTILEKLVRLKVLTQNDSKYSLDVSELETVKRNMFRDDKTDTILPNSSKLEDNLDDSIILSTSSKRFKRM